MRTRSPITMVEPVIVAGPRSVVQPVVAVTVPPVANRTCAVSGGTDAAESRSIRPVTTQSVPARGRSGSAVRLSTSRSSTAPAVMVNSSPASRHIGPEVRNETTHASCSNRPPGHAISVWPTWSRVSRWLSLRPLTSRWLQPASMPISTPTRKVMMIRVPGTSGRSFPLSVTAVDQNVRPDGQPSSLPTPAAPGLAVSPPPADPAGWAQADRAASAARAPIRATLLTRLVFSCG